MTNETQNKTTMRSLHPAWYQHEPGKEISELDLVDSLCSCFSLFEALGDLLSSVDENDITQSTLYHTGWLLINTAKEAENLTIQWTRQQHGNVTRLTTDGDQS